MIALAVEIIAKYFARIVLLALLCASLAAWALLRQRCFGLPAVAPRIWAT